MTFEELLIACSSGKMPKVRTQGGSIGTVCVIKDNGRHKGCAVNFPGIAWDTWFTDSDETDKRTRYMRELSLEK